jgi:hypothetical protein
MGEIIYNRIRQDLISNQKDLLNMQHYYTHKHRSGSRLLDINVAIFKDTRDTNIVQIYVADKNFKVRERLVLTDNSILIDTDVVIKRYN